MNFSSNIQIKTNKEKDFLQKLRMKINNLDANINKKQPKLEETIDKYSTKIESVI